MRHEEDPLPLDGTLEVDMLMGRSSDGARKTILPGKSILLTLEP